jgi:hypothetical protein
MAVLKSFIPNRGYAIANRDACEFIATIESFNPY